MAVWTWFPIVGSVLFLMLLGAYRAHARSMRHGRGDDGPHRRAKPRAERVSATADPLLNGAREPSSTYRGHICFFDSTEHRDMFEANHHVPLALDRTMAQEDEPRTRPLERSEGSGGPGR